MNTNELAASQTVVSILDLLIRQDLLTKFTPITNVWGGCDLWIDHMHSMGVRITDDDGTINVYELTNYGPTGAYASFSNMPASVIVATVAAYL